MEFKINNKSLEKLLNKIITVVPTKSADSRLENFLFEIKNGVMFVYASDMEVSMKVWTNVSTQKETSFASPARKLVDTVRSLGDVSVDVSIKEGKIIIKSDNGVYENPIVDAKEFPEPPSFPKGAKNFNEIKIDSLDLKKALEIVSFAMSKEDMRPSMMGTLFEFCEEGLRFVATDGHKLANFLKKNIKSEQHEKYIIPERAVNVLHRILEEGELKAKFSATHAAFSIGESEFITRLISQKYPDYASVIPIDNENLMKIKTAEVLNASKRMAPYSASSQQKKVKLTISENALEMSAEDLDTGCAAREKIHCDYKGGNIEIGFNVLYVNEILTHTALASESEEAVFKINSPTKAVLVTPEKCKEDEDLVMLLMPVRLNS